MSHTATVLNAYGLLLGMGIVCFGVYLRLIYPRQCNYKIKTVAYLWMLSGLAVVSLNAGSLHPLSIFEGPLLVLAYVLLSAISVYAAIFTMQYIEHVSTEYDHHTIRRLL